MHYPISVTLLALAATSPISAISLWPRTDSCPSVWKEVASELQSAFAGCGADAHGAIRAPFHDCINNGCDGSLILSDECSRRENSGLTDICGKLKGWTDKYKVGAADMIQFAAATAISACPLGPRVQALVGRKDNKAASNVGSVPSSRGSVSSILSAFSAKGFSAEDVVALLGTHSVALQFNDDPAQAGKALDSTPGTYDNTFYKETKAGTAPYSLQSDRLMSNATETEAAWSSFADSTDKWLAAFTSAWNRFAVIGNDAGQLKDCSSLIAGSRASRKRMEANAKFTERMSAKFRI
ncbi:ligninase LG6 precursor [Curvularia clavata]|uniref:Peroxidase n=1 Tax=Curvularia clavata TaxID=95742 RepID=A0A9Q8ZA88_CURCL|nr:ligninase LG6 precursor [Curvularia clavata]